MNAHEQRLCETQGEFFALSAERFACGSALFVSRFMYSDLAKRLDQTRDSYNYMSPSILLTTMEKEYPSLQKEHGQHISGKVMRWMGYVYRAWCLIKQKESSSVYKTIKAEQMVALYDSFHTLSPEYCVDQLEQLAQERGDTMMSEYEVFKRIRQDK